ncbi:hypothetical protein ACFXHA_43595 [Nocardia sp. NPDC059240]|uniref:hypothetical protein n=1 Tax=Nocardia sp. NPDC059240 TaxID=3346786 RepID=UPI0036834006
MSALESVEYLLAHLDFDHDPPCDGNHHGAQVRPAARFRCDQHGCDVFLYCASCEHRERTQIEQTLAAGGTLTCIHCAQDFESFTECVQVAPIPPSGGAR